MNAPVTVSLSGMGFPQHFKLLHALLPQAEGFLIHDVEGQVVANSASLAERTDLSANVNYDIKPQHSVETGGRISRISNAYGGSMLGVHLNTFTGEPWGELVVMLPQSEAHQDDAVLEVLTLIGGMIDNEYKLNAELDAMAEELTDRYEELNLVYDNVYELLEVQSQGDAINHVIEHCAEHLNVGIVALVFEDSDKVYYATNEAFATRPYELIKHFDNDLIQAVQDAHASVIVNDVRDPLVARYNLTLPYKVLATPISAKRGRIGAALICITSMEDRDFMNSDRNLIEVMGKRVSKILQANRDDLTGLMNLRVLEVVLRRAVSSAHEEGVFHSFLNFDLHQLKVINDNYGREVGDQAIEHVGGLLASALRATDNIGYLGEGRYGVLLERCSMEEGLKVADSLCERIGQSEFIAEGERIALSASVGGTLIEPHTKNVDDILEAAEIAQEAAKKKGQSRIQAYLHDDEDLHQRRREMRWVSRIQSALENDQFRLHAQSIVPANPNSEVFHFEVLLRLVDEASDIVSPALFIPPAEKYNLMPSIDRWVITSSLELLASSGIPLAAGCGIMSINLSGQSLDDPGLVEHIRAGLKVTQVPPDCVCFEITETAAFGHLDMVRTLLDEIKGLGCKLSLDDFGTGLSSFSYLKSLPVDVLKIDGSFVSNILEDPVSDAMVSSINDIGHVMKICTVAEFVESEEIAQRLRDIGVDYLQGFGMAKPELMSDYLDAINIG